MLSIEDPPERPVCSMHGPLKWGYFTDTKQGPRWVSFVFDEGGKLEPHVCDNPDPTPVRWTPSEEVAERARRGRAFVDATVAAAKAQKLTEEEARDA